MKGALGDGRGARARRRQTTLPHQPILTRQKHSSLVDTAWVTDQPGTRLGAVTLADVTRPGVLAAIAEFDRVGRDEFLRVTGFRRARDYYLEFDGRLYDSKAIVGYAHGAATGTPLRPEDFSGGDKTVATRLRALDFTIRQFRRFDWTRDEIVLACALVEGNDWRTVAQEDPRAIELSRLLQTQAIHPLEGRAPTFRNPAGVERKTSDIVSRLPNYAGTPTNGNRLDGEVLREFLDHPEETRALAAAIKAALADGETASAEVPDPDLTDLSVEEGGVLLRTHLRRERSPRLRRDKLADAKRRGQAIACEACGFDFFRVYGPRGLDYIECHHRLPLHVGGKTHTRLKDLALICSNCHRMIHRKAPWLTVEELRILVNR
ncbi:HNH endonuclease [Candidatus Protofrankia californiensis]|uniref:HNH endonuclease n=1 Tax=Candidatus Protofrankia californiensis TaxID=1839754 RepID=A0A1C3NU83_9ACTN|nr:HNH endonuclease [Candidatus Protofrankia californiensis]